MDNFSLPNTQLPNFSFDRPELAISMPTHYMWAETQFEIIKKYIQEFESQLDQEFSVGLLLTNFGQSITMEVREVSFEESVMMVYKGCVNGAPATLLQHINQISFLLTEIPRPEPEKQRNPIGFGSPQN